MSYKLYNVKVEGREYQVEVEEITDYPQEMNAISRPSGSEPEKKAQAVSSSSSSNQVIKAPLQGTIIGLNVKVGDKVKKGDLLLKIEALKMENEVLSSYDGVISEIKVQDGQRVASGDVLCSIT